jgi:hypothetical protein
MTQNVSFDRITPGLSWRFFNFSRALISLLFVDFRQWHFTKCHNSDMRKSKCLLETSEAADCTQEVKMDVFEVCSISYSADVFHLLPTRDYYYLVRLCQVPMVIKSWNGIEKYQITSFFRISDVFLYYVETHIWYEIRVGNLGISLVFEFLCMCWDSNSAPKL